MFTEDGRIWIAKNENEQYLELSRANRHGLIAGATGTGKTTTLRVLAESFSDAGVPVFAADIKGDLTGLAQPGQDSEGNRKSIEKLGMDKKGFEYRSYPVTFWDVFGEKGHPVRATISDMGPILLSNIMNLTDAQDGVLNIAFRIADDNGFLLIDIKDLRSVLQYVADNADEITLTYGNVSKQSVGALVRSLLTLENEGANHFFGEPALDLNDWLKLDSDGRGYINILECEKLFQKPRLYSTFMLWMLSELYELLPEVGDLDKPKMVFFFDEAHLLFDNCPSALLEKINQVVRLIRSKGVGVYFVTQTPNDLPDSVLGQLGNRIQHGLRAYTPAEIKKVNAAADTFRANPNFKTSEVILELGIGETLVSFIDQKGVPSIVERTHILYPPQSKDGALPASMILQLTAFDELAEKYDKELDRESAFEILAAEEEKRRKEKEEEEMNKIAAKEAEAKAKAEEKQRIAEEKARQKEEERERRQRQTTLNSLKRTVFNTVGRELTRSILGVLKKK
ncbi:MAG: DUF853 family protein [Erysipelotrichaceae bacterium]|nr:DUF853 family protein [Erysipelotrichaceae bacterium]